MAFCPCPELKNLNSATCDVTKEYEVARAYLGCLSDFTFGTDAEDCYFETITATGAIDATLGLVEMQFEGTDIDLKETGAYDKETGKSTWSDQLENFKLYTATPEDDKFVRGLLGKEIFIIIKLKGKSNDFVFRTAGIGGGMCFVDVNRSVQQQFWQLTTDGSGEERQLYILDTDADTTQALLDTLLRP